MTTVPGVAPEVRLSLGELVNCDGCGRLLLQVTDLARLGTAIELRCPGCRRITLLGPPLALGGALQPTLREAALRDLRTAEDGDDSGAADAVIAKLLRQIGYGDVVDAWMQACDGDYTL